MIVHLRVEGRCCNGGGYTCVMGWDQETESNTRVGGGQALNFYAYPDTGVIAQEEGLD